MPQPKHPAAFHCLSLRELVLFPYLGWTNEERAQVQEVRVTIDLRFETAPIGALSDQLKDTVCYAEIAQAVKSRVEKNEFRLIEHLGMSIYNVVKNLSLGNVAISVAVHKVRPPIENLVGGAWYQCGDIPK